MVLDLSTNPLAIAQAKCSVAYVHAQQMSGELIAFISMPHMLTPLNAGENIRKAKAALDEASAALGVVLETMEGG